MNGRFTEQKKQTTLRCMKRSQYSRSSWATRRPNRETAVKKSNISVHDMKLEPSLRQLRFSNRGPENLSDLELIEIVLSLALPGKIVKKVAFSLIAHFGSYAKAIRAPRSELESIEELGEDGICALKLVSETMIRTLRADVINRPVISNLNSFIEYLVALLFPDDREKLLCFFLDSRRRVIAEEIMAEGTVNALHIYPRELVKRALVLCATAVILVHNHPSAEPKPSEHDIITTKRINEVGNELGISLLDHIIISGSEWYSFREDGWL